MTSSYRLRDVHRWCVVDSFHALAVNGVYIHIYLLTYVLFANESTKDISVTKCLRTVARFNSSISIYTTYSLFVLSVSKHLLRAHYKESRLKSRLYRLLGNIIDIYFIRNSRNLRGISIFVIIIISKPNTNRRTNDE